MDKRRVTVLVAGQRFSIITDEEERYVIDLASKIDARISSISISQNMTRERAAVLTALDLADDGEHLRREMNEIKEQVKDYITQIEKLTEENTGLKTELSKAKLNNEALDDARKTIAEAHRENDALKAQIYALKEQIEMMQQMQYSQPAAQAAEEIPLPEEAPEEPQPSPEEDFSAANEQPAAEPAPAVVTAEDDLFFELPEEEPVRPQPPKKKKKNRDHSHVNPYREQFMKKQAEQQRGYTQQRQYSLFDDEE